MPSTTELLKTELGKAFVEIKEKQERINVSYRKNEIGENVALQWNPYTLQEKFPYANAISNAYDKMIERVIPKEAILSSSFESWINREKNELMINSKINRDDYFKEQKNFQTGETILNKGNDLIVAKIDFLEKELTRLEKAFNTHMEKNADKAFANEETLKKYENYYQNQLQKVNKILESGDFSYYDRKDKEGNVIKSGTQSDAQKHKSNIDNLIEKIHNAKNKENNSEAENVKDYVGDNLKKLKR